MIFKICAADLQSELKANWEAEKLLLEESKKVAEKKSNELDEQVSAQFVL